MVAAERTMKAIRRQEHVGRHGRLVVDGLHVPEGTAVEVIVLLADEATPDTEPLLSAAEESLAFWDNPIDDETWNDA